MADLAAPRVRLLRFGPFELDVRAGELRKHGIRIKLREQPVQILLMLLEHPGDVVLREEIRLRLWPNNTIVEFDHSINAAIKKLRDALGESADEPRYVETVARRGYRFLGEVEKIDEPQPEQQLAVHSVEAATSSLTGQVISHYRILEKLGAGGMGVVYRAKDLKLGRQVALKFLPSPAGELPQSTLQRFEREARAASTLNHPHICTIHGFEDLSGQPAIIMELMEGETLALRLSKGPLQRTQALRLALEIASALVEAHRKGIVHRDLKPANIMLTKTGAKVLDFGLAKAETHLVPVDESATIEGTILGTLHYMSPEQMQGKEADVRSDIFSFGLVLYEMITGKRAFERANPTSVIAAILEREPPALEPEGLNRVVRACLAKDPAERFQTARDLMRAIEWNVSGDGEMPFLETAPEFGGARQRWLAWALAAALAVGLASVTFLYVRERPPSPATPVRFQIPWPENANSRPLFSLSPDGRKLAFLAGDRLWVYSLESGESRDLTVASGVPFWSSDSRFIAYPSLGKLKKIEATGGAPQTVTDYRSLWGGGAWNQDDVIVFSARLVGLFRVPASGGVPVQITAVDPGRQETAHAFPFFLPDGRHFIYTRGTRDERKSSTYLGSVDAKPEQQSSKPLVNSDGNTNYAPSADPGIGYLLFMSEDTLMAQPFDNRRFELKGSAAPVAEQIGDYRSFSVSTNDVLVFQRSMPSQQRLAWYDRGGKVMGTVGEPDYYDNLALSPDGTRLAVVKVRGADSGNIWLLDLSRGGASTRFTFGSPADTFPVWSPDGSHMIFSSNRDGPYNLYQKPANGVKDEEVLLKSSEDKYATSWSRDGRFLLYTVVHPKTKSDIWMLPLGGDKKPLPFLSTEFSVHQACFSPDGHWVAYVSNESGHQEVYVRSFSMNSTGTSVEAGGKWQISNGFGVDPRWRNDGRELYYRLFDGNVMAVEIATKPEFRAESLQHFGLVIPREAMWDSVADGSRFLAPNVDRPEAYTVVLNWQAALKK
jgi:serine/threonine protein kinase/Tol biopolymer transport system component